MAYLGAVNSAASVKIEIPSSCRYDGGDPVKKIRSFDHSWSGSTAYMKEPLSLATMEKVEGVDVAVTAAPFSGEEGAVTKRPVAIF